MSDAAVINRATLTAWYRAARPRTLTATYVPLGAAGLLAVQDGVFDLARFTLSLIGALFLQVGANLINEYFDFKRGADTGKEAGQGMIIKQNLLTPEQVRAGAVITVLAGVLIGLFLLVNSGPLLLWIGLGGVLVVILYTAGPFPLAYNGLGEVAVFIFMGPIMVLGAYYVMAREFSPTPLIVGLPIGLLVAAILHANNIRDMEADRAVNKRTLALVFGRRGAFIEYAVLVYGAYVGVLALIIGGVLPITALAVAITLPEAYRLVEIVRTQNDTPALHMAQGRTARLHGQFGLWLVIGWALWLIAASLIG